ncbi:MAG: transposase [Candidatus Paceibacteria bacterium]
MKLEAVMAYEEGEVALSEVLGRYEVPRQTFDHWIRRYQADGADAFLKPRSWKTYTKELKTNAVLDWVHGRHSDNEILRKYGISSHGVLERWVNQYTSHRELKSTSGGRKAMTKGRKTTFDERLEAVLDCIGQNRNYRETAETHRVSYQQLYLWVKKYDQGGPDALLDRRGRNKEDGTFTPEELVQVEMRRLAKENEFLRMQNDYLKKLKEVERGQN